MCMECRSAPGTYLSRRGGGGWTIRPAASTLRGGIREMMTLTFLAGTRKGTKVAILDDEMTLGRDESCSVVVNDAKVSRVHCTLHREPDRLWIEDHGSLNGISVNGTRARQADLTRGDTVRMGDTVFMLTSAESEIQALSTGKTVYRKMGPAPEAKGPSTRVVSEIDQRRGHTPDRKADEKDRSKPRRWWPARPRRS